MKELAEQLRSELKDREYREGYDEAFLDHRIATQIRVIREQRGLTQKQLAEAANMKQSRISAMEDEDYGSWSVNTLRRVAYKLGVRLTVDFSEWGDLLREVEQSGREDLQRRRFEDDPAFLENTEASNQPQNTIQDFVFTQTSPTLPATVIFEVKQGLHAPRGRSLRLKPKQNGWRASECQTMMTM